MISQIDGWMGEPQIVDAFFLEREQTTMEKAKKKRSGSQDRAPDLRCRAEEFLRSSAREISKMAVKDIQGLVHELQVHQIELELQNEELRHAQLELADSRDRYSDLYDFAPVGYVTLDEKGRIIESNLTLAAKLGVEREKLIGQAIFHFVDDASVDNCYSHLQAVFGSDKKRVCELNLRKKGGGLLAVRLASIIQRPVTAENPRCLTAVVDITDLFTARRQLQQLNEELEHDVRARVSQLRHSESEFRALADNVPELFSYVDSDQRYRYVNLRYGEFWQRPISTILGNTVAEVIGPLPYEVVGPQVAKVLRGEAVTYDVDCDPPDGRHAMHVRCIPDFGDDGEVRGFYALLIDVTEAKRVQEALDQYKQDLKKMSSELLLTEERERQRLAQDLHDGIGQELFRARMKLDQIVTAGDAAVKEVGTILEDIGKLVNTVTLDLSPLALRQLGFRAAMGKLIRDMSEDYGLSVQVEDDGQPILLDERVAIVLFRAVRELLINVAKHAKTDQALVSIRRLDGKLQVAVQDEGIGFNPSSEAHLVGTGRFGLFSLRERLEYLNGTFQIQSVPGDGTTAILTVPLQVELLKNKN